MSEATIKVASVLEKKSKKGKDYWLVKDANDEAYFCWEKGMGEVAKLAQANDQRVKITYEEDNGYKTASEVAGPLDGKPEDKLGTGEYVKGQSAPADARGMAASVALKAAVDTYRIMDGAGKNGAALIKSVEATANEYFRWLLANRDDTYRKVDEDIPF